MVTLEVERGAMQIDVSGAAIDVTGQSEDAVVLRLSGVSPATMHFSGVGLERACRTR